MGHYYFILGHYHLVIPKSIQIWGKTPYFLNIFNFGQFWPAEIDKKAGRLKLATLARMRRPYSRGSLRKLGGSGSPGQLLQQQLTKIFNLVRRVSGGGAKNQKKAHV